MSTAHAAAPLPPLDTGFLGHPRGLFVCFATELWERFSFYGMKFLLLLYLTKYHLFSDSDGLEVLGAYAALVYAMPVIGGLLADRYLGMVVTLAVGCGIAFELPLVTAGLARAGILTARWLLGRWRYAVLGCFGGAAILTPSPDAVTMLMVGVPLVALYFAGVGTAALAGRARTRR